MSTRSPFRSFVPPAPAKCDRCGKLETVLTDIDLGALLDSYERTLTEGLDAFAALEAFAPLSTSDDLQRAVKTRRALFTAQLEVVQSAREKWVRGQYSVLEHLGIILK